MDPDPAFDREAPAERRDDATVARCLRAAAAFVRGTDDHFPFPAGPGGSWFSEPLGYTGEAGALGTTDNAYCMGRWRLGPDEELVVTTTPVACRYWSLQLWNHWGQSLTLTLDDVNYPELIVNDNIAESDSSGEVTIVISSVRPAEPDWLNTFGWEHGTMIFRFMFPEAKPAKPDITVRTKRICLDDSKGAELMSGVVVTGGAWESALRVPRSLSLRDARCAYGIYRRMSRMRRPGSA